MSSSGLDGILVTTTHGGIQDSEAQSDASDASFHNHYVALTDANPLCPALAVVDISWEQPGSVSIVDKTAVVSGPNAFVGTHSLTGDPVAFANDGTIGLVV